MVTSSWTEPQDSERNVRWARELFEALRPHLAEAAYVNYLGDEGQDGVRSAYGAKLERLALLKAKFDPPNLFRMNQNVAPGRSLGVGLRPSGFGPDMVSGLSTLDFGLWGFPALGIPTPEARARSSYLLFQYAF